MKIYEYTPPKNTKRVTGLILVFAFAGAGLFLLPMLIKGIPFGWISQILGIAAITAVIFLISRCMARTFVYAVVDDNGAPDFTVTELTNGDRKQTTVCRVALSNITEAYMLYTERAGDAERIKKLSARARSEGRKQFNYCHDIGSTPVCLLFLEECGEPLFIKISPDETLFSYFERYKSEKREEEEE